MHNRQHRMESEETEMASLEGIKQVRLGAEGAGLFLTLSCFNVFKFYFLLDSH